MAGSTAIQMVAQKYLPEVIAGVEHPIDYLDALVEKDRIVVKMKAEMDLALRGWIGYAVPVKKGKLGVEQAVVVGEPSPAEFVIWARRQSVKTLKSYLAANQITATGNIGYMLAYRLTYLYDQRWRERAGTWPLSPEQAAIRKRRIKFVDHFINIEGVGDHPDEAAIVQKIFLEEGKLTFGTLEKERRVTEEREEKKSDILKRLRQQAEQANQDSTKGGKSTDKDTSSTNEKTKSGEVDAVKAGKKRAKKAPAEPVERHKAEPAEPEPETSTESAAEPAESESDVKTKRNVKTKAVATAKKADKKAEKKERRERADVKAKAFPVGSKVKYIGTRVKHHIGKSGEVLAHISDSGVKIKWSDGVVASATAGALKKV